MNSGYLSYQTVSGTKDGGITSVWVPEPDDMRVVYKALKSSQEARDVLLDEIRSLTTLDVISLELDDYCRAIKITWRSQSQTPFFKHPTVAETLARFGDTEDAYLDRPAAAEARAVCYLVLDVAHRWNKQLKWIVPFVLAYTTSRTDSI